jgi:hypothetical protein
MNITDTDNDDFLSCVVTWDFPVSYLWAIFLNLTYFADLLGN